MQRSTIHVGGRKEAVLFTCITFTNISVVGIISGVPGAMYYLDSAGITKSLLPEGKCAQFSVYTRTCGSWADIHCELLYCQLVKNYNGNSLSIHGGP